MDRTTLARVGEPHELTKPLMTVEQIDVKMRSVGGRECMTAIGRDVYSFLSIAGDYTSWMKVNLARARLKENRDYEVFMAANENPGGGRPRTEYVLTLEAAKHICMLSETERGYEAREYFIDCECRAEASAQKLPATGNQLDLLQGMLDAMRQTDARIARVEQSNAQTVAVVAEIRDDLPALVSNAHARADVHGLSNGALSMNGLKSLWNKRAKLRDDVVEYILRQSKRFRISPTERVAAGFQRHSDGTMVTDASGAPVACKAYPGYQSGLANRMITKFLRECERIPDTKYATHPEIEGRFVVADGFCKGESRTKTKVVDIREAACRVQDGR